MESYQLIIKLGETFETRVGNLGLFSFPRGFYIYTGSARRNLEARIQRHLLKFKKLHWHIDYLLKDLNANIVQIERSMERECKLDKNVHGKIIVPGFGSSDCVEKCESHLKYFDSLNLGKKSTVEKYEISQIQYTF